MRDRLRELAERVDQALAPRADAHRYPTLDDYGAALDELRRRETLSPGVRPTMAKAKDVPKAGDACPQCDGQFKAARQPSDEQRAAAANRDNPVPFPPDYDTAAPEFVKEHGQLYKCQSCGYQTRMQAAPQRPSSAQTGSASATSSGPSAESAGSAAGGGRRDADGNANPFPAAGSQ